jgi:hypothetical protein
VYDVDYVHVFVSVRLKVCVLGMFVFCGLFLLVCCFQGFCSLGSIFGVVICGLRVMLLELLVMLLVLKSKIT